MTRRPYLPRWQKRAAAQSCTRRRAPAALAPRSPPSLPSAASRHCWHQSLVSRAMTQSSRYHVSSSTTCRRWAASPPPRVAFASSPERTGAAMRQFLLPDLGEGLEEAEIVAWHVTEGDHVVADQPLVSVETDKAVVEVPS